VSRVALTVVILVVAVTSGCGGSDSGGGTPVSKAEYERRIDAVGSDVPAWFNDLRQIFFYHLDLNQAGRDEAADHIELIQKRIRDHADGLDGVIPPEDAEAEHDELIDALRDYAGELDGFKKAMDAPSLSLAEAGERIIDAGQAFEKLGYGPWLTDDAVRALPCPSRATYSWPRGPWCTE
jgi:hypothetical protein